MKRNYIVKLLLLLLLAFGLSACWRKKTRGPTTASHQLQVDSSLTALLKPANEQVIASIPVIQVSQGTKIDIQEVQGRISYDTRNQINLASRVAGRIEKLYIKYNYQPVKKGQLVMEIYAPDLAAAQRELLLIQRSGNQDQLLELGKQRLRLLGMQDQQISTMLRTGQIQYRIPVYSNATGYILENQSTTNTTTAPASPSANVGTGMDNMAGSSATTAANANQMATVPNDAALLLREGQYLNAGQNIFTIYQTGKLMAEFSLTPSVAAQLHQEDKIIIQKTANRQESLVGRIGLIQPVFNAGANFVLARVYLQTKQFQVGELVTGQLPLTVKGAWLPQAAILSMGNSQIIFKKQGKVFVPITVQTGVSQNGYVQVFGQLADWKIAKNAAYLIDSESFAKTEKKGVQ